VKTISDKIARHGLFIRAKMIAGDVSSGAGSISKVKGHKFWREAQSFFTVPPYFFVVLP